MHTSSSPGYRYADAVTQIILHAQHLLYICYSTYTIILYVQGATAACTSMLSQVMQRPCNEYFTVVANTALLNTSAADAQPAPNPSQINA